MKIYNPFCLLAIGLFFTTHSQATTQLGSLVWGDLAEKKNAYVTYKRDYDPYGFYRSISLSVEHSINGEQRFYITPYVTDSNARCNLYTVGTTTMTFNDQAVKMNRFCNSYADAKNVTHYSYSPATERGHQFVVNLFKTSIVPVKLTFDGDTLYVPVEGFTKVWNSAGGNAI